MPGIDWSHPWLLGPVSFGLGFLAAVVLTGWRAYDALQREREREWRDGWSAGFRQGQTYEQAFGGAEGSEFGLLVRGARRLAVLDAQRRQWARREGETA